MQIKAKYFDGQRATARLVLLKRRAGELLVFDAATHENLFSWKINTLKHDEKYPTAMVLMLENGSARIEILDLASGRAFFPELAGQFHRTRWLVVALWLAVLLAIGAAVFAFSPYLAEQVVNLTPWSVEEKIQKVLAKDIVSQDVCKLTPTARSALNSLVKRIYPLDKTDFFTLQVEVMNEPGENAFAFFAGHLYLTSGLLKNAKSPDEIAGILAHEIEHAKRRHVMKALVRRSAMLILFRFMAGDVSWFAVDPGTVAQIISLGFDRDFEREADRGAFARLRTAKVSTQPMADFFARLKKYDFVPALISTHPASEERAELFAQAKADASASKPIDLGNGWAALQNACNVKSLEK